MSKKIRFKKFINNVFISKRYIKSIYFLFSLFKLNNIKIFHFNRKEAFYEFFFVNNVIVFYYLLSFIGVWLRSYSSCSSCSIFLYFLNILLSFLFSDEFFFLNYFGYDTYNIIFSRSRMIYFIFLYHIRLYRLTNLFFLHIYCNIYSYLP